TADEEVVGEPVVWARATGIVTQRKPLPDQQRAKHERRRERNATIGFAVDRRPPPERAAGSESQGKGRQQQPERPPWPDERQGPARDRAGRIPPPSASIGSDAGVDHTVVEEVEREHAEHESADDV